jgi:hypothetical protein
MRYFLAALAVDLLAIWLVLGGHAHAQSSYRCPGFEPAAPVGCHGSPRCMCDAGGRCSWVFDCGDDQLTSRKRHAPDAPRG